MEYKTFTPGEANALLPELIEILNKLRVLMNDYRKLHIDLETTKKTWSSLSPDRNAREEDPFFEEESRIDFTRMEIDLLIDNFSRNGVLLKSIDPGLFDFPAVINGENVLICWKEGEERITHYHGWNDGFMGRKPLPET